MLLAHFTAHAAGGGGDGSPSVESIVLITIHKMADRQSHEAPPHPQAGNLLISKALWESDEPKKNLTLLKHN